MSNTFAQDAVTVEHLIHEMTRPVGQRRASASQFAHTTGGRVGNRRGAPRVNLVASNVFIQLDDEVVSAVDVSLRGIQFRCSRRVVPGSTVMLKLRYKNESPSVALGRIMWAAFERPSHVSVPHYRVGVVFEAADVRIIRAMLQQCGFGQGETAEVEVVR